MNGLDFFILVVLVVGLVRGFATGVIRQVASVAGLLLAFVLSVQLMRPVGGVVIDSLGISPRVAPLVGFILVFFAIQVLVFLLVRVVETLVGALRLTVLNRLAGGAVGALQAALLLSILFLVLGYFGVPEEPTQRASVLYRPVASVLPAAWDFASDKMPRIEKLSRRFGPRLDAPPDH